MNSKIFSFRPRSNVFDLFDSIPNKVIEWREKWLYIECATGSPIPPTVMNLEVWLPVGKRPITQITTRNFLTS